MDVDIFCHEELELVDCRFAISLEAATPLSQLCAQWHAYEADRKALATALQNADPLLRRPETMADDGEKPALDVTYAFRCLREAIHHVTREASTHTIIHNALRKGLSAQDLRAVGLATTLLAKHQRRMLRAHIDVQRGCGEMFMALVHNEAPPEVLVRLSKAASTLDWKHAGYLRNVKAFIEQLVERLESMPAEEMTKVLASGKPGEA